MNTNKFNGFFSPANIKAPIHIIGCGAIGSVLATHLTRVGGQDFYLWDFDKVEEHNLANQEFNLQDVGRLKDEMVAHKIRMINPHALIELRGEYEDEKLEGYVFICVDSIETRKRIVKNNMLNPRVRTFSDFRMRLKDAQHFMSWDSNTHEQLLKTMNFTSEEAKEHTPTNACGMSMSIMPTVQTVVAVGIANWINYLMHAEPRQMVMVNPFDY